MPYSEHACRLHDPANYNTFRRENCGGKHDGKCVDFIYGFKEGGGSDIQAMRYKTDVWTEAAAKSHCASHNGTFEAAKPKEEEDMGKFLNFTHSSNTADSEPGWGSVDKGSLPRIAHADQGDPNKKSTWGYPHHWISGGSTKDDNGIWTNGTMYLHKGGLNAAWAAAQGARSGQEASSAVKAHLQAHRSALGLDDNKEEDLIQFKGFFIQSKATEAEVWIYEEIGDGWGGGISAKKFADEIKDLGKVDSITLRINSPGGDVFDGIAIYNILKQNPARVIVYVDGLAASIASIIAMAGDEIHMAGNATMMIHKAWGISRGNSEDMTSMAETLSKLDNTLAATYAKKTGMDKSKVSQMMKEETWMNSQEAFNMGFIDNVTEDLKLAAHFDLDKFDYRHNPFVDKAKVEEAPEADAMPAVDEGEPMLPDVSIFDEAIKRCESILKKEFKQT